jgi:hypothetical protein
MRSFRFPSISKGRSLIKQDDYHPLANLDDVDYTMQHDRREDLSRWRLMALTCCAGGLQVVLSLIMSNGTVRLIEPTYEIGLELTINGSHFSSPSDYQSR